MQTVRAHETKYHSQDTQMITALSLWFGRYLNTLFGIAILSLGTVAAVQTYRVASAKRAEAEAKMQLASFTANAEANARKASEKYRSLETAMRAQLEENQHAAETKLAEAQAAAARANIAAIGLRQRAAQLAAACRSAPSNPSPIASRTPTNTPGDLLADMLGRVDEVAGETSRYADQLRIAGEACARDYETVRSKHAD